MDDKRIFDEVLDYGLLGALVFVLGYVVYNYWMRDQNEIKRLNERINQLEEENIILKEKLREID
jgi:hypothetical protein